MESPIAVEAGTQPKELVPSITAASTAQARIQLRYALEESLGEPILTFDATYANRLAALGMPTYRTRVTLAQPDAANKDTYIGAISQSQIKVYAVQNFPFSDDTDTWRDRINGGIKQNTDPFVVFRSAITGQLQEDFLAAQLVMRLQRDFDEMEALRLQPRERIEAAREESRRIVALARMQLTTGKAVGQPDIVGSEKLIDAANHYLKQLEQPVEEIRGDEDYEALPAIMELRRQDPSSPLIAFNSGHLHTLAKDFGITIPQHEGDFVAFFADRLLGQLDTPEKMAAMLSLMHAELVLPRNIYLALHDSDQRVRKRLHTALDKHEFSPPIASLLTHEIIDRSRDRSVAGYFPPSFFQILTEQEKGMSYIFDAIQRRDARFQDMTNEKSIAFRLQEDLSSVRQILGKEDVLAA